MNPHELLQPVGALPYVAAPLTDLDLADEAAHQAAEQWGIGKPSRLRAGMNVLYRCGDEVLRVSRPTARADAGLDLVRSLAAAGLPVLTPTRDDVFVTSTLIDADHLRTVTVTAWPYVAENRALTGADWEAVGGAIARLHQLEPDDVPADYPRPSPARFPWWQFDALLADIAPDIDDVALAAMRRTVEDARGWDDFATTVICHGDVHRGNVLVAVDGPVLIDWDLLATAPPQFDHAVLLGAARNWGADPDDYRAFAAGYGHDFSNDQLALTLVNLRDLAATALRVQAGRHNPAAAAEAERRLRWWRGDPDAPTWRAQ